DSTTPTPCRQPPRSPSPPGRRPERLAKCPLVRWPLLPGGLAVLGYDLSRDPSAVLDVDAVLPRPRPDSYGVDGTELTGAAGGTTRTAADFAGMGDVVLQGVAQLSAVLGAQVYLIVGAIQGKADCAL